MPEDTKTKNRAKVADLIFKILTQKLCVRDALFAYPNFDTDTSLEAAWHAILHYEADEDLRAKDLEYAQVQDDFLESLAFLLQKGEDLPANIISQYKNFYKESLICKPQKGKNLWKMLCRFLNIKQ